VVRNLVAMGLQDLDRVLIQSPLLGSIYELFFRKETYHRIDSRLCYIHLIPMVVKQVAEEVTGEKGIKLVEQYELSPVLGELYKPARASPERADVPIAAPPRISL
jgi:hypothetical protein